MQSTRRITLYDKNQDLWAGLAQELAEQVKEQVTVLDKLLSTDGGSGGGGGGCNDRPTLRDALGEVVQTTATVTVNISPNFAEGRAKR